MRPLLLLLLTILPGCDAIENGAEVLAGKRCASNPINTCHDDEVCVSGDCLPKCSSDDECSSNWCAEVSSPAGAKACYPERSE